MNAAFLISLVAGTLNLGTALLLAAISLSAAWRAARLFSLIALSAGLYSLVNLVFCTDGLPVSLYLFAGRLEYLIGTIHCVCWLLPAFGGPQASPRQLPPPVRRVAQVSLTLGVFLALSGIHLQSSVGIIEVPWARAKYHYPNTTLIGDLYGLLMLAVLALSFFQFLRRVYRGEKSLRLQAVGFCLYFLCITVEVLVANRVLQFVSLSDVGFILLILPVTIQVVRRILVDSQQLLLLTTHLEEEVRQRTQERDRTQLALVEAERLAAIGRLAAGVGHEINNPLTYLQLALTEIELFHRAGAIPPHIREALAKAQEGSRRIKKVVEGLRSHSRRQEDRGPLELAQLTEAAAKVASPHLRTVASFSCEHEAGIRIFGNESSLIQAIANLLINAAQAVAQQDGGGSVKVWTARGGAGGKAILTVEDNGPGIPAEHLPRLSTPYFTTRTSSGGLGLGLFVTRGIVNTHGGQLEFETKPGTGTQVRLILPCIADNLQPSETATAHPAPKPSLFTSLIDTMAPLAQPETDPLEKRKPSGQTAAEPALPGTPPLVMRREGLPRLLLIDDDLYLGQMLSRALRKDFIVTMTPSAAEALRFLEAEQFDAALCDLMMPGMSGMELAEVLGARYPALRTHTLFLTGGAFSSEAEAFLARPDVLHLGKPVNLAELKTKLLRILEQ